MKYKPCEYVAILDRIERALDPVDWDLLRCADAVRKVLDDADTTCCDDSTAWNLTWDIRHYARVAREGYRDEFDDLEDQRKHPLAVDLLDSVERLRAHLDYGEFDDCRGD